MHSFSPVQTSWGEHSVSSQQFEMSQATAKYSHERGSKASREEPDILELETRPTWDTEVVGGGGARAMSKGCSVPGSINTASSVT